MGFMKDLGMAAISPLGYALTHKKKAAASPQPSMISSGPLGQPASMIGRPRPGGY